MRLSLNVTGGPGTGRSGIAGPGRPLYVGRGVMSHLRVPDDADLLPVHFEVECSEAVCRLRDVSGPAGIKVNGTALRACDLKPGDVIHAGQSVFVVQEAATPAATLSPISAGATMPAPRSFVAPPTATPVAAGPTSVLSALRAQPEPLYAILDAARDPLVYAGLLDCGEKHESLYDGAKGQELAFVAPYLVQLTPGKPFLEKLVKSGWGNSWGVFLTCSSPFDDIRKHLRHFLMVQLDGGKKVYFRFYDPRVLRAFLPSCTSEELVTFFGPINAYLMEADEPTTLLRMTARDKPVKVAVMVG